MRIRSAWSSRSDCPFESYNKRSSAMSRGRGAGEPAVGGPIDATRPIRALLPKSPRLPLSRLSETQARASAWRQPSMDFLTFIAFFQAEDGIRDLTVTGVQTCALPI